MMMVALLALAGCTKYNVECELVLQPRVMVSEGSNPLTPAYMARVYVWYIDKKEHLDHNWRPESYADAEMGVVRHRGTGEVWPFGLTGRRKITTKTLYLTLVAFFCQKLIASST